MELQSSIPATPNAGLAAFCERHFRALALITLMCAAFNLGFRLNREVVTAWDESLYATSAAEMVQSGNWLVTTFHGDIDYYNTKPPLNVWLIAASFKFFGVSLWSLRLPAVIAGFLVIAVLQWWARRCFGALTALLSTLVLSTTFAFFYVHSARSGNPDAWLTLFVLLTVVTLWSATTHPFRLAWLGPLAAGVFLLKGTAVLLPVVIVAGVLAARGVTKTDLRALLAALVLFLIPSGAWAVARWRFDRWRFFDAMVNYDFVARTTRPLEGHDHGVFYYLNILQKDHYDWLSIAVLLIVVLALARRERLVRFPRVDRDLKILLAVWAGTTLLVPTIMVTKLAWYLDPFYPAFALGVAVVITRAFETFPLSTHARERLVVAAMVVVGFGVAEGKLLWYSYQQRDLSGSMQGFFLDSREMLAERRVLSENWDPADYFVLKHIARAVPVTGNPRTLAAGVDEHDLLILESVRDGVWTLTSAPDRFPSSQP